MLVIGEATQLREMISYWRKEGDSIGLVPTMGFLHEGHLSLVSAARKQNKKVIVSIFVNPLQFGPNEDFDTYPRNAERDVELLDKAGCDVIFMPDARTFYGNSFQSHVEVENLSKILIGEFRPGHFRGVTTVCAKLFNIVMPDRVYFGQKDFQQVAVIRQMVHDLNFPLEINMLPIVREPSGLAMSSRNALLTSEQKQQATALSAAVKTGNETFENGVHDARLIEAAARKVIEQHAPGFTIAYVVVVDAKTLSLVLDKAKDSDVLLVEAYADKVRLYDNIVLSN